MTYQKKKQRRTAKFEENGHPVEGFEKTDVRFCNCDPFEGESPIACGCGRDHIYLIKGNILHWRGKHWRLWCAFEWATNKLHDYEKLENE